MQTLTAFDAMPVARARAQQATGDQFPGATSLWSHANQLWDDEFKAYQTLHALGLQSAANAAWERSKAAGQLTLIYVTAL